MKDRQLLWIETTRYSEFFRCLFQEYATSFHVVIDGKKFDETQFPDLIKNWCLNDRIRRTKNFALFSGKTVLFGFHDGPDELWAAYKELPFIKKMAENKVIRFQIMAQRHE